ncbi:hypothetical protein Tco_0400633 [Tanacetum coccineum]
MSSMHASNYAKKVLDLEKTKTTQANEIASLKRRVKKLEQKKRSRTHGLKRLYKVGLTARVESSGDEQILVDAAQVSTAATTVTITTEEVTLAQALADLKSTKPKAKGIAFREPAKVDADYQLAKRLQAEEQEQFTIEEKATLIKELLEQRRKHFAAKRAEEKRNKPPTKTQQKKIMITYLKNMEG